MPSQPLSQTDSPNAARNLTPEPPRVHSRELLRGTNLILIEHAGDRYYLRMTRNNKLILTK